jgi:putative acetyltransferase
VIRAESPADAAAVRAVHKAAFPTDVEARLVDAIRANGNDRVSLVAEAQARIVGHVLFSPVDVEGKTHGVVKYGMEFSGFA